MGNNRIHSVHAVESISIPHTSHMSNRVVQIVQGNEKIYKNTPNAYDIKTRLQYYYTGIYMYVHIECTRASTIMMAGSLSPTHHVHIRGG